MTARPSHIKRLFILAAMMLIACVLSACDVALPTSTPAAPAVRTPKPTFTPVPTNTLVPTITPLSRATDTAMPTEVPPTVAPLDTPTPDVLISPLTGRNVDDISRVTRRVLAVRIGNDPVIRPQDGLGTADIVYEELMEGYFVTRYTALYLESNAERIRPVRSARLVSLAIAPQYDAALVHSGASDRIRWLISQASFVDLDEFFHPEPYSTLEGYDWRGRMYTSVSRIHEYLRAQGLERDSRIDGYTFDETLPAGESASSIDIPYPGASTVAWEYQPANGVYGRFVEGQAHMGGLTGEQITASNVIIFYAEHKATDIVEDSLGNTAIDIVMSGEGRAQVCRDGLVVDATWRPTEPNGLIQYFDGQGKIIPLRPGTSWIEIVPLDYDVTVE